MPVARRSLLSDRVGFGVAMGAVMLGILLILTVQSVYWGVKHEYASFIERLPGNVWVAPEGVRLVAFSSSFLTDQNVADIASIPGVHSVNRLWGRLTSLPANGVPKEVYVWSMRPGEPLAENDSLLLPPPGVIYIDRGYAQRAGLSEGDGIDYDGHRLTVGRVGSIGNVLIAEFAMMNPDDFVAIFGEPGPAKFVSVSVDELRKQDVIQEIDKRIPHSAAYTSADFIGVAQQPVHDFLAIVSVISAISFIVGLSVLTMTIYTATLKRAQDYSVMKVLGASSADLYRTVLAQSAVIGFGGFALGSALAVAVNRVAPTLVPEFVTYLRWQDIALALGLSSVMIVFASIIPISRVARLDPASVFRA